MSVRGLRVVHELFGQERTPVGFPLNSLPPAPSVRVPVGPAAAIPPPTTIRTSTARPKPSNAAIPVARRADEQVQVGEAVLVASNRERMATVATVAAVNAKLASEVFPDVGYSDYFPDYSFAGRSAAGGEERVRIVSSIPDEVARWRPDGVVISGELTADELSGDFRDQSDRLTNVCVQGPTPFLRKVPEKVGTRVYVLLVREAHVRMVPAEALGGLYDATDGFPPLVAWLEGKPREATEVVCKGVEEIVVPGLKRSFLGTVKASPLDLLGSAWETAGGWWRAEAIGWSYRFQVATTKEIMQEGPSDAVGRDVCRVVRAWPLGRVADNNLKLRGEAATTLVVGVGPALVEHAAFERFAGDPARRLRVRVGAKTVLEQIL